MQNARLRSPAAARNRQPILEILQQALPAEARILEVASGSGEHAVYFGGAMPGWQWHPSDPDPEAVASIDAWRRHAGTTNVCAPVRLDVVAGDWPRGTYDGVVAINLVHIAPWAVTEALLTGAAQRLRDNGALILYGPYKRAGRHTASSNEAFDADLRARDPRWGVRDLDDVEAAARAHGLTLEHVAELPANNLAVVFRRGSTISAPAAPGPETEEA